MQDEVARLAHPVINYALKIKDRLERGEDVTPERSRAELERLLTPTAGSRTELRQRRRRPLRARLAGLTNYSFFTRHGVSAGTSPSWNSSYSGVTSGRFGSGKRRIGRWPAAMSHSSRCSSYAWRSASGEAWPITRPA